MEAFVHDLEHLFQQLGLPSSEQDISKFIAQHKLTDDGLELFKADFWTPAQANFLRETIQQDSDWCEATDQLDTLLRH